MRNCLFFLIPSLALAQSQERPGYLPVTVNALQEEGGPLILGGNPNPCPMQVSLEFPELEGLVPDTAVPAYRILPPSTTGVRLVSLASKPGTRFGYRFRYRAHPGDPTTAKHDPAHVYWLPWEHGKVHRLTQGYMGDFSHKNDHALDFEMEPGTVVTAARGGVVAALREDSTEGGAEERFKDLSNFVDILHEDGTFAHYSHLAPDGVDVAIGQTVAAGAPLGSSGQTGFTASPHLHFEVRMPVREKEPATLPTVFLDHRGAPAALVVGHHYPAFHPGKGAVEKPGHELVNEDLEGAIEPAPATGKFDIVEVKRDGVVVLRGVNGRDLPARVTVEVGGENVVPSKPIPYVVEVAARSSVFLMLVRPQDPGAAWRFRYSFRLEP